MVEQRTNGIGPEAEEDPEAVPKKCSPDLYEEYKRAKYAVRRAIAEAKNRFWANKLAEMTTQEAYGLIKTL